MQREGDGTKYCEGCGAPSTSEPLRSIRMRDGTRDLLCEGCFKRELNDGTVSELDPRLLGENA